MKSGISTALALLVSVAGCMHTTTGIAPTAAPAMAPSMAPAADAPRRRIYLLRHGDVNYFEANGQRVGNPDIVRLTDRGHDQARAAGKWFRAMGVTRFDRVITSDLPRAQQTAHDLLDSMDLPGAQAESWPELRELRSGSVAALDALAPEARERAITAFAQPRVQADARLLGGESLAEARARILPALDRLRGQSWDTALIVAHSLVNEVILSEALTNTPELYGRIEQGTACINILDMGPGPNEWVVRAINVCPDTSIYWTRQSVLERLRR